jgi:hypothetical protein
VYTPAQGKKAGNGSWEMAEITERRNAACFRPSRGKPAALIALKPRCRSHAARRAVSEAPKPLAPYAVEQKLKLLISYRTVL